MLKEEGKSLLPPATELIYSSEVHSYRPASRHQSVLIKWLRISVCAGLMLEKLCVMCILPSDQRGCCPRILVAQRRPQGHPLGLQIQGLLWHYIHYIIRLVRSTPPQKKKN